MTCRSAATVALLVCFGVGGEDDRAERCVWICRRPKPKLPMNNNVAKCISKYKKGLTVHLLQHESTVFPILLDQNTTLVSSKSIKLKVKMFIVI